MTIHKNERKILDDLMRFFLLHEEDDFILHTDILNWGTVNVGANKKETLEKYWDPVRQASAGKRLLLPTFNYDYSKSRIYNVLKDKCQVGILNEYVRSINPENRTHTPIFNFVEFPGRAYTHTPSANPFGEGSTWGEFCRRRGRICFLGVVSDANTFAHHVEEVKDIGYRYLKPMPGVVSSDRSETTVDFVFRVRPAIKDLIAYDWVHLSRELQNAGLLTREPLGMGEIISYNSFKAMEFILEKLKSDELYLLTEKSKARIFELRRTKSYPFRFEDFEGEGAER